MNKLSSRIFQYLGIFLLSLFISYLVFSFADRNRNLEQDVNIKGVPDTEQIAATEQTADINIVGTWQSEPVLEQLGVIQSSYTFNADGSYSSKADFISWCKVQRGLNCEYFWLLSDGRYSVENGVITLSNIETKAEILIKGQHKPEIKVQTDYPKSQEYMVNIDEGNLVITDIQNNHSVILIPFVATEQVKTTPSVDAQDVEQAADIVGMWQSERDPRTYHYYPAIYTFNADGSYARKVDLVIFCKDEREPNCEEFWRFTDGSYSVGNGVITLSPKESRKEILRKGLSQPEISSPTFYTHSNKYIAKLDAGRLYMTNKKSNESVILKPIDND